MEVGEFVVLRRWPGMNAGERCAWSKKTCGVSRSRPGEEAGVEDSGR